jgi:uncharacterized protein (TIGR03435 family)
MRSPIEKGPKARRKFLFAATGGMALAAACAMTTSWAQAPTTNSPAVPQWQKDAGAQMSFEVASVKQNKCGLPPDCSIDSNINLEPGDAYSPTGGLLTVTNWYLNPLIVFAYKLNANQFQLLRSQLPTWAKTERFDIQARALGSSPTKDQVRLMMQSLLADRFKLAVHAEIRQLPVFALVLDKPGRTGPLLKLHSDFPPCETVTSSTAPLATVAGGYPSRCGVTVELPSSARGLAHFSARNVAIEQIGPDLSPVVGRPILDKTELKGNFDFSIEFFPEPNGPAPTAATVQAEPTGPTLLEALKDQLGLKLVSQTGPVEVLVIDHVEELSPN